MTVELEEVVMRRNNRGRAIGVIAVAILILVIAVAMIVLGAYISFKNIALGLLLIGIGLFSGALGIKTWEEAMNRWQWRITVTPKALHLVLPRGRTQVHKLKRFNGTISRESIAAIVTRLEGFRTMGVANLQRVFALQLTDGSILHLGEDRALGTGLYSPFYDACVQTIAERYNLPLTDYGMVTTGGGFLGVFGVKVPEWSAAAVDDVEAANTWHRARRAGVVIMWLVYIVLLVQALDFVL